jgi:hypothetical protein
MAFPGTIAGSLLVRDLPAAEVLDRLERALGERWLAAVDREGSVLSYRVGVFRAGPSWSVSAPITEGSLQVTEVDGGVRIAYQASLHGLVIFATAAIALFFAPPVLLLPGPPPVVGLGVLAASWLWLVGGNYLLTTLRLPSFLARALAPAAVQREPRGHPGVTTGG